MNRRSPSWSAPSDYKINARRSAFAAKARVAHLTAFFGEWRAVAITSDVARRYVAHRQDEKAVNGTINRELVALGRMFRLAMPAGKLVAAPHLAKLEEAPPRQGFFEHPEYLAVRAHLPADYQDVLDFGYHSGGAVRLRPEQSKTKDGRLLVLSPPLASVASGAGRPAPSAARTSSTSGAGGSATGGRPG